MGWQTSEAARNQQLDASSVLSKGRITRGTCNASEPKTLIAQMKRSYSLHFLAEECLVRWFGEMKRALGRNTGICTLRTRDGGRRDVHRCQVWRGRIRSEAGEDYRRETGSGGVSLNEGRGHALARTKEVMNINMHIYNPAFAREQAPHTIRRMLLHLATWRQGDSKRELSF